MIDFFNKFEPYKLPQLGLVRLPQITIALEEKTKRKLPENISNYDFLCSLVKEGLDQKKHKFSKEKLNKYLEQIDFELKLVEELFFTDYFLLVWLVINKARELGAFIDYGRGSCAASLCFYLMGITGVDPIDKKLIFSRFISRVRAKKQVIDGITYLEGDLAPDVDLNLGGVRDEIVDWLKEVYKGKICKIAAIGTFTGKILIKDVFKILEEANETDAKEVADLVEKHFGIVEDLEKMPEKNKEFKKWSEKYPKVFETALKMRDLVRQKSSHASGYLISFYDLDGFIPLEINKDKEPTCSYEMGDAASIAIKLDLLGLTSNEIINNVLKNIKDNINEIDLDNDSLIYDQFQHNTLLPYGLYQISADCAYRVLNAVKPKNIYELSDVNAIARPGALAYLDGYVGNESKSPHPLFDKILAPTRNYCLYQEQMMQMAVAVGFTLDEAELLRRVVGKKKVDEVKLWKQRIYDKCKDNGFVIEIGDILWKILDDSAKYSFNLSHSISTSYLSALTVYLKYKYPLYFYLSCLQAVRNLPNPVDEINLIQRETTTFGIRLLPPHILKSDLDFKLEENNIRFGLSNVKGIAEKTIQKLNKFRNEYSTKFDIFKAAEEAGLSIGVLSSLILVGSLDHEKFNTTRSKLVLEAQLYKLLTEKEKNLINDFAIEFNYSLIDIIKHMKTAKDIKGKPLIKESRHATLKRNFEPFHKMYLHNKINEKYAQYWFEKNLLGFAYSSQLIDIFKEHCGDLVTIQQVKDSHDGGYVHFVTQAYDVKSGISKNKNKYIKMGCSDNTGSMQVLLCDSAKSSKIDESIETNGKEIEVNDIIIIRGQKSKDIVFANRISIQECSIFDKISKLKMTTKGEKSLDGSEKV